MGQQARQDQYQKRVDCLWCQSFARSTRNILFGGELMVGAHIPGRGFLRAAERALPPQKAWERRLVHIQLGVQFYALALPLVTLHAVLTSVPAVTLGRPKKCRSPQSRPAHGDTASPRCAHTQTTRLRHTNARGVTSTQGPVSLPKSHVNFSVTDDDLSGDSPPSHDPRHGSSRFTHCHVV